MAVEEKVKQVLQDVLDVKPEMIDNDSKLEEAFGVDSTEMVEINVAIKKALGVAIANNDLKKTQSFSEIVAFLKSKGAN